MSMSGRFNQKVKAQLLSKPTTSATVQYIDPSCFSRAFLDMEDRDQDLNGPTDTSSTDYETSSGEDATTEKLSNLMRKIRSNPTSLRLQDAAIKACSEETVSSLQSVAARLRKEGWDASVCRTKWASSGGVTAGSYEYIDVVSDDYGLAKRYIVDVRFREQFVVARGSEEYERTVEIVPSVMVGREEEVKEVVEVMAEEVRRSMRKEGLSVPPWRKRRYLTAKWFGDCKRVGGERVALVRGGEGVKCREVGFGVLGGGGESVRLMTRI